MSYDAASTNGYPYQLQISGVTDELIVLSITANTAISTLYNFTVSFLSTNTYYNVNAKLASQVNAFATAVNIINAAATLTFPNDGNASPVPQITGVVSTCTQSDTYYQDSSGNIYSLYTISIVPAAQSLLSTKNNRVFLNKTIPEIINSVLTEAQVNFVAQLTLPAATQYSDGVAQSYPNNNLTTNKFPFIFQYEETDLNFVSRLMEQAGLIYYFSFTASSNTATSTSSSQISPETLIYVDNTVGATSTSNSSTSSNSASTGGLSVNPYASTLNYSAVVVTADTINTSNSSSTPSGSSGYATFYGLNVMNKVLPGTVEYDCCNFNQIFWNNYQALTTKKSSGNSSAGTASSSSTSSTSSSSTATSSSSATSPPFSTSPPAGGDVVGPMFQTYATSNPNRVPTYGTSNQNPVSTAVHRHFSHTDLQQQGVNDGAYLMYNALLWQSQLYHFKTTAVLMLPGYTTTLNFSNSTIFNFLPTQAYTVISADYSISLQNAIFKNLGFSAATNSTPDSTVCSVSAIPATINYNTPFLTPKPIINGFIPALIVGSQAAGTVELDQDGCYTINIPVNQNTDSTNIPGMVKNETSVTTSEGVFAPLKIGTQILLAFQNGDPDAPMIAGTVSTLNNPSLVTSANQTQVIQYYSSKGGAASGGSGSSGSLPSENIKSNETNTTGWQPGALTLVYDGEAGNESYTVHYPDGSNYVITQQKMKQYTNVDFDNLYAGNTYSVTMGNSDSITQGNQTTTVEGDTTYTVLGNSHNTTTGNSYSTIKGNSFDKTIGSSFSIRYGNEMNVTFGAMDNVMMSQGAMLFMGLNSMLNIGINMNVNIGPHFEISNGGKWGLRSVHFENSLSVHSKQAPIINQTAGVLTMESGVATLTAETLILTAGTIIINGGEVLVNAGTKVEDLALAINNAGLTLDE